MAATLVTAFAGTSDNSPESRRSRRASELWDITGNASVAGDTGTLTTRHVHTPQKVIGPYAYSVSGRVVTLTAYFSQSGTQTTTVEVVGEEV